MIHKRTQMSHHIPAPVPPAIDTSLRNRSKWARTSSGAPFPLHSHVICKLRQPHACHFYRLQLLRARQNKRVQILNVILPRGPVTWTQVEHRKKNQSTFPTKNSARKERVWKEIFLVKLVDMLCQGTTCWAVFCFWIHDARCDALFEFGRQEQNAQDYFGNQEAGTYWTVASYQT